MRIIGGKYKGKRFQVQGHITARPTTDFAKEALFNILANKIDFEDVKILDLFAGIGSISAEFISRGSKTVWSVEQNKKLVRFINDFTPQLDAEGKLKVIQADVFKFLNTCSVKFDIIFADPPYFHEKVDKLPEIIIEKKLLTSGGFIILEHDKNHDFQHHPNFSETRKYGNVHFTFFEPSQEEE